MIEIVEKISNGMASSLTIYAVLSDAIGTNDKTELLKSRAAIVKAIEGVLRQTDHDEEVEEIVEDFIAILSESNLTIAANKSGLSWSKAHLATMKMLLRSYSRTDGVRISLEIDEIIAEIKTLDASDAQKEMLEEIFTAIEELHAEHSVIGDRAYRILQIKLAGLFGLYRDTFEQTEKPMKDAIMRIYNAVIKARELSDAAAAIGNTIAPILPYIV